MKKSVLAGALGLALSLGLASNAFAEDVSATIRLDQAGQMGQAALPGVNIGDEVTLTLINPTNQPLQFHTDEAIGPEESWLVPANSQRVITFTYTQPFSDDMEYHVVDPMGNTVSQGLLLDLRETGEDIQQAVTGNDTQTDPNVLSSPSPTPVDTQAGTQVEQEATVRGYW